MTYKLVTEYSAAKLEAAVNEMIADGFKPLGGPYAVPDKRPHANVIYYRHTQAMTQE